LLLYLDHYRISPYSFERGLGIANGYLKKQLRGKGSVGSDILEKILAKHRDLNLTWLLTGNGEMLTGSYPVDRQELHQLREDDAPYGMQQQMIELLREQVSILESSLADKERIIQLLEQQLRK
jgi:hypothetical protein